MNPIIFRWMKRGFGPLTAVLFLAAGCADSKQEMMAKDQLERARSAYLQAKASRNVEAFAPLPFADAGKAMQAAEQARTPQEMEQLSYIAEKKALIAISVAEGKLAENEIEKLSRDTANIIAEKRTQEAKAAQKEAEKARLLAMTEAEKAERARREAEARRQEAEGARREAEARRQEAEQARLAALAEAERAARAKSEAEAKTREAEQARLAARAEAEKAALAKAEASRAKAEADQLMRELSNLKAKQTERGIVLTIGDVLFAVGKADLSKDAMRSVERLAEFLQKYPNRNVLIEGHTDSTGSDELNMALSQKRADSVKDALTEKGIAEGRITPKGYGKTYPLASNDNLAGRQQNRRVEVIILNEGVNPETQFRQ